MAQKGSEIDHVTSSFLAPQARSLDRFRFALAEFPYAPQDSPYTLKASVLASTRFRVEERSDTSLAHDRETRVAPIHLNTEFTDIEAKA